MYLEHIKISTYMLESLVRAAVESAREKANAALGFSTRRLCYASPEELDKIDELLGEAETAISDLRRVVDIYTREQEEAAANTAGEKREGGSAAADGSCATREGGEA